MGNWCRLALSTFVVALRVYRQPGLLPQKSLSAKRKPSRFFTGYPAPNPCNPEWLISGLSNSPKIAGLVMGPTMGHQIIRELFDNTIEAAGLLGSIMNLRHN